MRTSIEDLKRGNSVSGKSRRSIVNRFFKGLHDVWWKMHYFKCVHFVTFFKRGNKSSWDPMLRPLNEIFKRKCFFFIRVHFTTEGLLPPKLIWLQKKSQTVMSYDTISNLPKISFLTETCPSFIKYLFLIFNRHLNNPSCSPSSSHSLWLIRTQIMSRITNIF